MAVPATVLYYTTYDQLRIYFQSILPSEKKLYAPIFAGGISRGKISMSWIFRYDFMNIHM